MSAAGGVYVKTKDGNVAGNNAAISLKIAGIDNSSNVSDNGSVAVGINLPFVTSWIMRARIVLRYIPAFATAKPAFHRTIALTSFAPLTLPQIRFRANWSLEYTRKI